MPFLSSVKDKLSRKESLQSEKGLSGSRGNPFRRSFGGGSSPVGTDGRPTSQLNDPNHAGAPPAYTLTPTPQHMVAEQENPFSKLKDFDTVFLIDDSGSMRNLWSDTANALKEVARICTQNDEDGIDIYFLNHKSGNVDEDKADGGYYNIRSEKQVEQCFSRVRPSGGTPTGGRLSHILEPYMKLLKRAKRITNIKQMNLIVITDGAANDEPAENIKIVAKQLGALNAPYNQVGIQFFQVGCDPWAKQELDMLDDMAKEGGFLDIVDTTPFDKVKGLSGADLGHALLKVVMGGMNRGLDRQAW